MTCIEEDYAFGLCHVTSYVLVHYFICLHTYGYSMMYTLLGFGFNLNKAYVCDSMSWNP